MDETIGLIGVGLLGSAILDRLLCAGRSVWVWDIDPARRAEAAARGATVASTIDDLLSQSATIILCLPDSPAVQSVADPLSLARPATMVVDTTTGDPEWTVRIAHRLQQHGLSYVDATVVGSSHQMRQGEAVLLVGAEAEAFARVRLLLELLAAQVFHVGPPGSGSRMKLVVNLALGLHRAVLAEALGLARACGLDPEQTLQILRQSAAYSRVMDTKGSKMVGHDFRPEARLAQHAKDVQLILELARRSGARVPLSETHQRLLTTLLDQGLGGLDNSVIIRAFAP